jgi:hypothetical protein
VGDPESIKGVDIKDDLNIMGSSKIEGGEGSLEGKRESGRIH